MAELSPSEINVLKSLQKADQSFKELKGLVKNKKGGNISDRGLSIALKNLQEREFIKRLPSRKYHIDPKGKDYLERNKLTQSIKDEDIFYSKEILLKLNLDEIYDAPYVHLQNSPGEFSPSPIPIHATFLGSKEIRDMIDFSEWFYREVYHGDIRKFENSFLEEVFSPLKLYFNEVIFSKCLEVAKKYKFCADKKIKKRPKVDIDLLNFNLSLIFRFNGKEILDRIKKNIFDVKTMKLKKEIEERLVGLILLKLASFYTPECEYIIPAMVEGGLIDKKESEELQKLFEKIHGKTEYEKSRRGKKKLIVHKVLSSHASYKEREKARAQLMIKALKHLKKGNGLYIPKTATHGIEDTGLTVDDIFNEITESIKKLG
ncbi:MAG: hypothetical protein QW589_01410 [Candidatus Bathyarchaeia archaeon]